MSTRFLRRLFRNEHLVGPWGLLVSWLDVGGGGGWMYHSGCIGERSMVFVSNVSLAAVGGLLPVPMTCCCLLVMSDCV